MIENRNPLRHVYTLVVFALAVFIGSFLAKQFFFDREGAVLSAPPVVPAPGELLASERNTIEVFQRASPAVVFVHNLRYVRTSVFTTDVREVRSGTGSGFLWDRQGHIVTNFHVVQDANRVAVTLIDGKTYEAKVIGVEERKDLAVLKIELLETNVESFDGKIADTSKLLVGQKAIAIGNPFGLDHTLTVGNISSLSRSMPSVVPGVTVRDMIQTDAPINPGNSGGPLLDSSGRLIGMNTLILRDSTGIGFAVPAHTIKRIVSQIIEHGQALQSGIGISIFDDRTSRGLGAEGVVVREVYRGTPADKAGIRGTTLDAFGRIVVGDVILSVDGKRTRNYDDLYNAFDTVQPGETIEVVYLHEGVETKAEVEVVIVGE